VYWNGETAVTLTAERVQAALAPRAVRFLAVADSTNDSARDWLRAGASAGAAVLADEQRRGRGRMGRTWQTPPGAALAVSVILYPPPAALPRLSMLAAAAVCDLLERLGCADVGIKWPNDVQLNGRKVCGVLVETEWAGDRLLGAVVGIGLNVRVDFTGTELAQTAISLADVLDSVPDRLDLLVALLTRLDDWYARLETPALYDAWRGRLTTLGQRVSISGQGEPVTGTAESVDAQGALLVRDAAGALQRVVAGDIALG
jgi:BirA family biotin operon repressor/biotin-[acetyl-CoA-carboxylase] ligase